MSCHHLFTPYRFLQTFFFSWLEFHNVNIYFNVMSHSVKWHLVSLISFSLKRLHLCDKASKLDANAPSWLWLHPIKWKLQSQRGFKWQVCCP
jgi:hypothetical protein